MLKSFVQVHNTQEHEQHLLLIDNSTDEQTRELLHDNKIPYKCSPGNTHGQGINEALELCKTDYALLVDTDIIFLKNHVDIFEQFKSLDLMLMGKIEGDRGGKKIHKRVNPWHCFINVKKMKECGLIYFDANKMKASFSTDCIYDIGSTFFEDIRKKQLKIGDVNFHSNYFFHLEGMSWYKNKFDPTKPDTGIDFGGTHNNPGFVESYEQKMLFYKNIQQQYENIDITNKFI
jgi:hypothetical protein